MKSQKYVKPENVIYQTGAPCTTINLGSLDGGGFVSDQETVPILQGKEEYVWDFDSECIFGE